MPHLQIVIASTRPARKGPAIAAWFAIQREDKFPPTIVVSFDRAQSLRYGEKPGQDAALRRRGGCLGTSLE